LVLGYICGIIFIPKYISQQKALIICTIIALTGSLLLVLTPPEISVYSFFIVALGCSMMWPALWPLAIVDLGRFTKKGSALLVTAIVGGAVIPLIFGLLKDSIGAQPAYWLMFPCFLFILYYGIVGNKIRN
jgi:fucose permease